MNSSIWPIHGTLTGTSNLSQSGPESNCSEGVLQIPQSSNTGASPSDSLLSYSGYPLEGACLTTLQRCSQRIQDPQPTGLKNKL